MYYKWVNVKLCRLCSLDGSFVLVMHELPFVFSVSMHCWLHVQASDQSLQNVGSYGRVDELVYFAGLKEQYEIVVHHYIQVRHLLT